MGKYDEECWKCGMPTKFHPRLQRLAVRGLVEKAIDFGATVEVVQQIRDNFRYRIEKRIENYSFDPTREVPNEKTSSSRLQELRLNLFFASLHGEKTGVTSLCDMIDDLPLDLQNSHEEYMPRGSRGLVSGDGIISCTSKDKNAVVAQDSKVLPTTTFTSQEQQKTTTAMQDDKEEIDSNVLPDTRRLWT
ncbi:unnamed protein product [Amoebophrya sp. A25]|nr:unnamed protein product [Amoebophrya sp. A25]|eukprot:GSA25T00025923001.1